MRAELSRDSERLGVGVCGLGERPRKPKGTKPVRTAHCVHFGEQGTRELRRRGKRELPRGGCGPVPCVDDAGAGAGAGTGEGADVGQVVTPVSDGTGEGGQMGTTSSAWAAGATSAVAITPVATSDVSVLWRTTSPP